MDSKERAPVRISLGDSGWHLEAGWKGKKRRWGIVRPDGTWAATLPDGDAQAFAAAMRPAALVDGLREALELVMSLFVAPGETSIECLEKLADEFSRETGMMAPFKSQSPYDNTHSQSEREEAYNNWRNARIAKGFSALAAQPQAPAAQHREAWQPIETAINNQNESE